MGKKFYECEQDNSYCYQDSCILKNKLGIRNKEQLEEAERNITALRILQLKTGELRGEPNFKYLCKIHKHIFGDIYSWAGKIRTVDISKGNMFCNSQFILENAEDIFNRLKKENYLQDYKDVNKITISLLGTGFLRYMVRNIVGTLIEIGEGKRKSEDIITILESQDRKQAGKTAHPEGLYLKDVFY